MPHSLGGGAAAYVGGYWYTAALCCNGNKGQSSPACWPAHAAAQACVPLWLPPLEQCVPYLEQQAHTAEVVPRTWVGARTGRPEAGGRRAVDGAGRGCEFSRCRARSREHTACNSTSSMHLQVACRGLRLGMCTPAASSHLLRVSLQNKGRREAVGHCPETAETYGSEASKHWKRASIHRRQTSAARLHSSLTCGGGAPYGGAAAAP